MRRWTVLLLLCASGFVWPQTAASTAKMSALAQRPYMGWSSWSSLRGKPTEEKIKAQVSALFAADLPELGYRYINIDSGWSDGYDEHGIPKPNLTAFPGGMDGLSAYLHSRGLRFGLYLGPGIRPSLYDANPVIAGTHVHIQDITDKIPARRNSAKRLQDRLQQARGSRLHPIGRQSVRAVEGGLHQA